MASMIQKSLFAIFLMGAMVHYTDACAAFVNGPWAMANKHYWKTSEMGPQCLSEWQQRGGNSITFTGHFAAPAGANAQQQAELNSMIIFRRHCLNICIWNGNGNPGHGTIQLAKGVNYVDSPNPDLVTMKCICQGGATSVSKNMRQLHDEFMRTCHYSSQSTPSPTTMSTGTDPPMATTLNPNNANGDNAFYMGCYHDTAADRTLKGPSTFIPLNGKWACARYCYQFGYKYFGLEYFTECYCGDDSDLPLASTRTIEQNHANITCRKNPDKEHGPGKASACNLNNQADPLRDYTNGPWCGGDLFVDIYMIFPSA